MIKEIPMADYDIIIKDGTVVDGTRTPRYVSDIAIKQVCGSASKRRSRNRVALDHKGQGRWLR